jgi:lysophospholipase L1-like esterase
MTKVENKSKSTTSSSSISSSITNNYKPRQIINIDDFSVDNSQYESPSNSVDSTLVMNTTNKTLAITKGTYFTNSYKAHKNSYGKNIMINTMFQAASQYPQIGLRINAKDTISAHIWYQPTNTADLRLLKVTNNIGGSIILSQLNTFDGSGTVDLEVSVRSFNELTECIGKIGSYVVAMNRYIDSSGFNTLTGIGNGFGANGTATYKNYLKASVLDEYINIVCLGDSNTLGNGLTLKQTYPAQLQAKYFDKNVGVINKGVSGNRVSQVASRLSTDVYSQKISGARNIVILQIGTNDATDGTAANTIYNNIINNLVSPIQRQGFEVWLSTVPVRANNSAALTIVKSLNTLILSNTRSNKILDLYALTVDTSDTIIANTLQADNLHLTERTCNLFASLISNNIGN